MPTAEPGTVAPAAEIDQLTLPPEARVRFGSANWLLIHRGSTDHGGTEEVWAWPMKGHGLFVSFRTFLDDQYEEETLFLNGPSLTELVEKRVEGGVEREVIIDRWISKDSAPGAIQRASGPRPAGV